MQTKGKKRRYNSGFKTVECNEEVSVSCVADDCRLVKVSKGEEEVIFFKATLKLFASTSENCPQRDFSRGAKDQAYVLLAGATCQANDSESKFKKLTIDSENPEALKKQIIETLCSCESNTPDLLYSDSEEQKIGLWSVDGEEKDIYRKVVKFELDVPSNEYRAVHNINIDRYIQVELLGDKAGSNNFPKVVAGTYNPLENIISPDPTAFEDLSANQIILKDYFNDDSRLLAQYGVIVYTKA